MNRPILKSIAFSALSIFLFSSCAQSSKKRSSSSCMSKYVNHLDKMLTKSALSKQIDIPEEVKVKYDSSLRSPKYHSYIFSWPGKANRKDRRMIMGKDYGPKNYKIGVKKLSFMDDDIDDPVALFYRRHHTPTQEEKERAKEFMDKTMNKDKDISDKGKKTGDRMVASIMHNIKFTPIDGIADAAVWDHMDGCLSVLKGRTTFNVIVNISDDHKKNVDMAKRIAQGIIDKCY